VRLSAEATTDARAKGIRRAPTTQSVGYTVPPLFVVPVALLVALCLAGVVSCGGTPRCGPATGVVASVTDGDTIELQSGEKIRYLMVDTPETSGEVECYGVEARDFNRSLVHGQTVELRYDVDCTDRFDRLLAYVTVDGREVNRLLVERGFGCVLHIPPNGDDVVDDYQSLETTARDAKRGLWGACSVTPC
jgi:micrococcal nuclease